MAGGHAPPMAGGHEPPIPLRRHPTPPTTPYPTGECRTSASGASSSRSVRVAWYRPVHARAAGPWHRESLPLAAWAARQQRESSRLACIALSVVERAVDAWMRTCKQPASLELPPPASHQIMQPIPPTCRAPFGWRVGSRAPLLPGPLPPPQMTRWRRCSQTALAALRPAAPQPAAARRQARTARVSTAVEKKQSSRRALIVRSQSGFTFSLASLKYKMRGEMRQAMRARRAQAAGVYKAG